MITVKKTRQPDRSYVGPRVTADELSEIRERGRLVALGYGIDPDVASAALDGDPTYLITVRPQAEKEALRVRGMAAEAQLAVVFRRGLKPAERAALSARVSALLDRAERLEGFGR
jgi:hypothetical protein